MSVQWKQRREGGGRFALWLIRSIGRYGGRGVARACLYPITLYFLLRRGAERRDSRAWLGRALGRPATLRDVALIADEYDDKLMTKYGGQRMLDLLEESALENLMHKHPSKFDLDS